MDETEVLGYGQSSRMGMCKGDSSKGVFGCLSATRYLPGGFF